MYCRLRFSQLKGNRIAEGGCIYIAVCIVDYCILKVLNEIGGRRFSGSRKAWRRGKFACWRYRVTPESAGVSRLGVPYEIVGDRLFVSTKASSGGKRILRAR